mgnify:CR=1 FL=1
MFLCVLAALSITTLSVVTYSSNTFSDITIESTLVSSGTITNSTVGSQCKKMVVGVNGVYHVNKLNYYQGWLKGSLNSAFDQFQLISSPNVMDFDVS